MSLLRCEKVSRYFGKFAALKDVDYDVEKGTIYGIVGPNGAGKTTFFNVLSGIYGCSSGRINFGGRYIDHLSPYEICHLGISRSFQIPVSFPTMTVFENVLVGASFGRPKGGNPEKPSGDALSLVGMLDKRDMFPGPLALFDKKRLMIATALATEPKLLLLDEPTAGLNPIEIKKTIELIKMISQKGVTILLIEHIMRVIMGLCERIMVLNHGEKLADGPALEVIGDRKVVEAYLGEKYLVGENHV